MKKLLYQFDTDALPSVFDNVVGYDGGADHISAYGGVNAKNVGGLVEGAIFTRGLKDKKNTAIFIGGGNMVEGESVLAAVRKKFFAKFRVSVMFDCNGSNTTASAAVAWLAHGRSLAGKRAVVLGGSGPVGQRAAVLTSEGDPLRYALIDDMHADLRQPVDVGFASAEISTLFHRHAPFISWHPADRRLSRQVLHRGGRRIRGSVGADPDSGDH